MEERKGKGRGETTYCHCQVNMAEVVMVARRKDLHNDGSVVNVVEVRRETGDLSVLFHIGCRCAKPQYECRSCKNVQLQQKFCYFTDVLQK